MAFLEVVQSVTVHIYTELEQQHLQMFKNYLQKVKQRRLLLYYACLVHRVLALESSRNTGR